MDESQQINFDAIAEQYSEQVAAGKNPSLQDFVARYPEFATEIRELFPTLEVIAAVLPADNAPLRTVSSSCGFGEQAISDFRLIRELGRGGMGVVHEAEQLSLGRRVALKVLPVSCLLSSQRKARFSQEAKAAGRLHHSNIVPVFGTGSSDDVEFIVMQLIPGVSLDKLIFQLRQAKQLRTIFGQVDIAAWAAGNDNRTISNEDYDCDYQPAKTATGKEYWQDIAAIGRQVAEALQYAHDQGILHRDIKPGNLILDVDQRIWVSDFGLAKIVDSDQLTKSGDVLGTVKYMAPERLFGDYDTRSDIYSLGATLYELAALKPAFNTTNQETIARQMFRESPASLSALRPAIPRDFKTIVEKAMAHEPEHRYQTAGELAADLGRFLNDETIKARPANIVSSGIRWSRRNPLLASTVALFASFLITAAFVSTQAARHFRQLNTELVETNKDLEIAHANAKSEQNVSQQREARLIFQRGRELAERGKIAEGLLLMVDALKQCPKNMPEYNRVIRASISSWSALVPEILEISDDPFHSFRAIDYCANCPSGDFFVSVENDIRRIDAETGNEIGSRIKIDSTAAACSISSNGRRIGVITKAKTNEIQIFTFQDVGQPPIRLTVDEKVSLGRLHWHPNGKSVLAQAFNGDHIFWQDYNSTDFTTFRLSDESDLESLSIVRQFIPNVDLAKLRECKKNRTSRDSRLLFEDHHEFTQIVEQATGNHIRLELPHPMDILSTVEGAQIQCNHFRFRSLRSSSRFPPSSSAGLGGVGGPKYWTNSTAAFSADSEVVVTRDADIVFWGRPDRNVTRAAARIWNTRTGQTIGRPLQHQFDSVRAVAINDEGSIAATGGYQFGESSGAAYIWNARTGEKIVGPLMHRNYVSTLAFSPDSKLLAVGDYSHQLRFWDVQSGEEVGPAIQLSNIVNSVCFDPSGERIAVGTIGEFFSKDQLSVWDVATRECVSGKMPHASSSDGLEWVLGKNCLVSRDAKALKLWDLDDPQQPISTLEDIGRIDCAKVCNEGTFIAIGTSVGSVYLMSTATGEVLPNVLSHTSTVYDVDFGPDCKTLVTGCHDGGLRIWDLTTFEQIGPPMMQNDTVFRVKFRPDGKTVLSTCKDGTTRAWKVPGVCETPVDQLERLIEIRTGKRLANGIARKIQPPEWSELRELAIEENIMLDQAASAATTEGMPSLVEVVEQRDLHNSRAQDAEQDADWIGAYWHIDRIIGEREGKQDQLESAWQLYARRARTWTERGVFEKAELDYQEANSLLGNENEKLTDWYRNRVVTCQRTGNWETALWYLDRILQLDDSDWNSYAARAEVYLKMGKTREHKADFEMVNQLCDDPIYLRRHARVNSQARGQVGTQAK